MQELVNMVWAFAQAGHSDEQLLRATARVAERQVSEFKEQQISQLHELTLDACASELRAGPPPLWLSLRNHRFALSTAHNSPSHLRHDAVATVTSIDAFVLYEGEYVPMKIGGPNHYTLRI